MPVIHRPGPSVATLRHVLRVATCTVAAAAMTPVAARAAEPPSTAERFQIGTDPLVLCSAQLDRGSGVASGVYDRAYRLTCRDARVPVGRLYVLRTNRADPLPRLREARATHADCDAPASATMPDVGEGIALPCRDRELGVDYVAYEFRRGRELFVAEGLKGYDAALRMALRTLVLDRPVPGEIPVTTAGAEDPAAFARTIAATLDPFATRREAYRSNFGGEYLEAAEYFGGVKGRVAGTGLSIVEIALNEALQQSNIGNFAAAERIFGENASAAGDPLTGRLRRNYLALHALNQGQPEAAIAALEIAAPAPPLAASAPAPEIDVAASERLNAEGALVQTLARAAPPPLSVDERIAILDAQAAHIAGAALRLAGRADAARARIVPALHAMEALRGGRITSVFWLRAQMLGELAMLDEAEGDNGTAEAGYREAARLMGQEYPGTTAEWTSRLRLAGHLARRGQDGEAYDLFRRTVHEAAETGQTSALRQGLAPYFALLERRAAGDAAAVDEFFFASQTLVQLGVARSQFEFARILTSGSDEAAGLFRASADISRDINRSRLELARLDNAPAPAAIEQKASLAAAIARLEEQQTAMQARLNKSARYQVTTARPLTLKELQSVLGDREVYYKIFFVDGEAHALVATRGGARIVPLASSEATVARAVARLRASIRKDVGGVNYVMPFDVDTAFRLYRALIAPVAGELAGADHLIFEPDGALLSLPLSLLITERGGVDRYLARARDPAGDAYDLRGIAWLGRTLAISTTVSPRALHLVRRSRPASAPRPYLGLGENAPAPRVRQAVLSPDGASICALPEWAWNKPISSAELVLAQRESGAGSEVLTGAAFTDTALRARKDLDQYRVLHFATHGLVTPPGSECLSQPALMTSWAPQSSDGQGSDGLLSFQEVFSLSINADVVILSACETAAGASRESTQLALGELTGGGFALDGLVRAFMGAGARTVVASHWPVPQSPIDATTRLIGGLFHQGNGRPIAEALRQAQRAIMDDAQTSHPYYWAAFTVIGDGSQPLTRGD